MKTAICYYSSHHGNTLKLIDAIAQDYPEITLIDCTKKTEVNLLKYDMIGFASGIYNEHFAKQLKVFAQINLPDKKKVFLIYTASKLSSKYTKSMEEVVDGKQGNIVGIFGCKGFSTFGPYKLIGGTAKGHPSQDDLADAIRFYEGL